MPTAAVAVPSKSDAWGRFNAGDNVESLKDDLIDVDALVRMFEESEESTYTARQEAERDRDYVDNKQLTADELATLRKRGQPPMIDNRIKTKVDYLVGLEKQQRIDPRALPRTPQHEEDANGASQALRYVADTENFDYKRSGVWRNLLVEGAGGVSVSVEEGYGGIEIKLRRIPWDRMFWDPHSSELDFSDANYLGIVTWMDFDDAVLQYPDARDALENTLSTAPSDTYDDKPKFNMWADKKRKRVRVCQIWVRRDNQWHFAEFTKGGILKDGPSPYQTDKGESDCELYFQSAYVDRDNNRYGLVREMITLQDGINKRHSKALHQLNTTQIVMVEGAVADVEKARREAARPDGVIVVNPINGSLADTFKFETRVDLATAQFQLLQEAKNSIDLKGPNATQMGDKAQGSASASGRAIIASQEGGMISLGDLLDNLRHLDRRVFRAVWARIRQFWNEEKWIRVTDDERNTKWIGMNVDPMQAQMAMQQNPEMAQRIKGIVGSVAELDCDIIIDDAPDSVTPAIEQWQALTDLAKGGVPIPPDVLIQSAPNLQNKGELIEKMKEAQQQAAQQGDPAVEAERAKIGLMQEKAQAELAIKREQMAADIELDRERMGLEVETERQKNFMSVEVEREKAAIKVDSEKSVKKEQIKDAGSEASTAAITALAESLSGLKEAFLAPTKLIRDVNGRPVAAEKVIS